MRSASSGGIPGSIARSSPTRSLFSADIHRLSGRQDPAIGVAFGFADLTDLDGADVSTMLDNDGQFGIRLEPHKRAVVRVTAMVQHAER